MKLITLLIRDAMQVNCKKFKNIYDFRIL